MLRIKIATAILMLAASFAHAQPTTAPPTNYQQALKCRAYAPILVAYLTPMQARTFENYWAARSERLGKAAGLTPGQVAASTLVIELKSDDADAVLADCLEAWSKNSDRKEPL